MPTDTYQVKIIHHIHPHLIWVEVSSSSSRGSQEKVFEQIGIYGILPLETTINVEGNKLDIRKPSKWWPAATNLLNKYISGSKNLWFSPTYIDRRVSIFDDNIHKYGELLIKRSDGKLKKLSKQLIKSGFAYYDECEFHQKLSSGALKTRLENVEIQDIITQIERYYKLNEVPKSYWQGALRKQMSVYEVAKEIESSLTESNLEKHNNQMINKVLKNKMKDLELCKDVEEDSLGRAFVKPKESKHEKSKLLQRLMNQNKIFDNIQTYQDMKKFLDVNSKKEITVNEVTCGEVGLGSNSNHAKSQITKKYDSDNMDFDRSVTSKEEMKQELLKHTSMEAQMECKQGSFPDRLKEIDEEVSKFSLNQDKETYGTFEDRNSFSPLESSIKTNKSPRRKIRAQDVIYEKRVAFGPPGLNPLQYKMEAFTPPPNDPIKHPLTNVKVELCKFRTAELDSEVNVDISNKNILKDLLVDEMKTKTIEESPVKQTETKSSGTSSSSSSLLQRRLKVYKNIKTKHNNSSSSDTSVKDSSTNEEIAKNENSDEGIAEIIEKLDKEYNFSKTSDIVHEINDVELKAKKHLKNPFQNVDSSISVFVNKLAKPILMVHSKSNKRIEPVHTMRDIPFNSDIEIALRNMNIKQPMMLQSVSWLTVLRGHSLFLISPAKGGKTVGYLPAVCRLISDYNDDIESVGPKAIIVCATARSVSYVERLSKMFLGFHGRVVSCYAGVDDFHITASLLNGCDLLISTPSALVRLMQMDDFGVDLRRLCTFVIDDCERISNVYSSEINVFVYKIKQMLKNRAHKELKVQYILVSTVWCSFMESFAKKAPDTVVCIGAFQECVLYSKVNTSVVFVKSDNKLSSVHDFLKQIDTSKKTVIVCRSNEEVNFLENELKKSHHVVFACNNDMTVNDLHNINIAWHDYEEPVLGPILVCCDGNLMHMNVTDAHNLLQYSLPPKFSVFCRRFAVLNDNYPSIFNTENETIKIKILLEETNIEQLPKIINFVKRCTDNVPDVFDNICCRVMLEKDLAKAKSFVPVCGFLLSLGQCPDFYNCQERHTILKEYDTPLEWMPKIGIITFKIQHCHSPTHFSVKLLSNVANGVRNKFPELYSNLSLKLGMFYSKESNRQLHGVPKIGDICAVTLKRDLFVRCQVVKILSYYPRGNPQAVLVNLLDEKKFEVTTDVCLYHLPSDLKAIETYTVQVRLANIQPKDKDTTYSDLATDLVKKIVDSEDDTYIRGRIILTIKDCIFVDTLEACNDLKFFDNSTVVRHNIRQEILAKHALNNSEHIIKIKEMCSEIAIPEHSFEVDTFKNPKIKIDAAWSHLAGDDISSVFFASAVDPDTFFVRLDKFESCLGDLLKVIQKYAEDVEPLSEVNVGDIVIAKFPDDNTFERARVDEINEDKIKCFFVDQGDWREVPLMHLIPITDQFINKLPFQAIECRLVSIKPPGEKWSEFAINWLYDNCFDKSNNLKHLYVKYFTKEPARFTGGHKYGVTLTDTYGDYDIIMNQQMLNLKLACINEAEIEYISDITIQSKNVSTVETSGDEDWEKLTLDSAKSDDKVEESFDVVMQRPPSSSTPSFLLRQPIRSVPLVASDEESDASDKWDINMSEDFKEMFQSQNQNASQDQYSLPSAMKSIEGNESLGNSDVLVKKSLQDKNKLPLKIEIKNDDGAQTLNCVDKICQQNDDSSVQSQKSLISDDAQSEVIYEKTQNLQLVPKSENCFNTAVSKTDIQVVSDRLTKIKELDSDDLTSSEYSGLPDQIFVKQHQNCPKLVWRQNKEDVVIKIHLIGADYKLDIKERSLNFKANANNTKYEFNFELYGVINPSKSSHSNKGQYILVKLLKILHKNWLNLTKDASIKKWITYDIDYIDTSSDEDNDEPIKPIVYENSESDTELEDGFDDVN